MRVLLVAAGALPRQVGGVEVHVHGLARQLQRCGHEVLLVCRGDDPGRALLEVERGAHQGVPIARVHHRFETVAGFSDMFDDDALRDRFADVAGPFRPDVVHVHHLTCLSTGILPEARRLARRVVMTLHDFWMGCPRGQRVTPELELCDTLDPERCAPCVARMWGGFFGAARDGEDVAPGVSARRDTEQMARYHATVLERLLEADVLVTPSASSKRVFVSQGVPEARLRVVENGLDLERLSASPRRPPEGRFRLGYLGSVLPSKGVHVVLEALRLLDREDVEFHVHGAATPWHEIVDYERRLHDAAAPLGDRVRFHGPYAADDVSRVLAPLDAVVVPSLWLEAFCLTLREAWLAGLPVLASGLGAMAEAIEDGVTGLLFRPGDAADLAAAIARLVDDAGLRERLARSPKRVRSVAEMTADLIALYRGEGEAR